LKSTLAAMKAKYGKEVMVVGEFPSFSFFCLMFPPSF
jgi:hypothetical protein